MAKILSSEITPDLKYIVAILAEKAEYQTFKDRILQQMLKNVEVKGFRKGHAPEAVALKNIDPIKLQSTIIEETVQKFYSDLLPDIKKDLESKERIAIFPSATLHDDSEFNKETEEGFQFKVSILVLSKVDLSPLDNLEVKTPSAEKFEGRMTFKEFKEKETQGIMRQFNHYHDPASIAEEGNLIIADISEHQTGSELEPRLSKDVQIILGASPFPKKFEEKIIGSKKGEKKVFDLELAIGENPNVKFHFEVDIKEVYSPEFKKLEDVISHSKELQQQIKTPEEFEKLLEQIYEDETKQIVENQKRRVVIEAVVEKVNKVEIPKDAFDREVDRILGVLKERSITQKTSLKDAFAKSGLPGSESKLKDDNNVQKKIEEYVESEFKLIEILRYVYYSKVENPINEEDLKNLQNSMLKNPEKYNLAEADRSEEKVLDIAFDRLLREYAYQWIVSKIKFV